MLTPFSLLAQRGNTDGINKWLGENPLLLGLIFFAIGAVALAWGLYELKTGVASDKKGREHSGGTAKALAIVRIVAGAGIAIFGLYKMVAG